jgi:cellulose synthase/poly-beta-1,6-N-acetylglucosamine synthase-like glycosyltransferase
MTLSRRPGFSGRHKRETRGEAVGLASLLVAETVAAAAWLVVVALALADRRLMRRAVPQRALSGSGSVTAIVPARDEAANIADWVRDMLRQTHRSLRLVVVDDCSRDGTAVAALRAADGDDRVQVRAFGPPPDGWVGKPWAAYNAALHARSSWLLFSDADMRLAPSAVASALAAAKASGADALSLTATLECGSWWERQIMPAVAALIFSAIPVCLVHDDRVPNALLAGGFMLVKREAYLRIGGHRAVHASIAEDRDLAARFKAFGYRVRLFDGSALLRVRMYRGLRQMWEGWRKNFYEGVYRNPWLAAATVVLNVATLVVPMPVLAWLLVAGLRGTLSQRQRALAHVCAISSLSTIVVRLIRDRTIGFRTDALSLATTPLAGLFMAAVMTASAWGIISGRGQRWKGRMIR